MPDIYPSKSTPSYTVHKELRPDLFSVCALNAFPGHNSSPRTQMFSSHLSQRLNTTDQSLKYIQTGMEYEFGKYTFSISLPCNARVIRVIPRYNETQDQYSIEYNPQEIVIYEDLDDDEQHLIDILDIPRYCSNHQHFGFEYRPTEAYNSLTPKATIEKGTIIVDSPAKLPNGGYMYGKEINVAFMSHEAIAEDGILICRDVLDKFSYLTYESRVVEWGSKKFPLNLYGDENNYKAFPDIGEYIRDDGLLMMFRTLDKNLGPVEQSVYDMMTPDHIFDRSVYGAGPKGRIVDIRVQCGEDFGLNTLEGTDEQIMKYVHATNLFYQKIFDEYKRLQRERGKNLNISENFNRLLVEAQTAIIPVTNPKLNKLYRKAPLDDFRVEFIIEYVNTPKDGAKFTGISGDWILI